MKLAEALYQMYVAFVDNDITSLEKLIKPRTFCRKRTNRKRAFLPFYTFTPSQFYSLSLRCPKETQWETKLVTLLTEKLTPEEYAVSGRFLAKDPPFVLAIYLADEACLNWLMNTYSERFDEAIEENLSFFTALIRMGHQFRIIEPSLLRLLQVIKIQHEFGDLTNDNIASIVISLTKLLNSTASEKIRNAILFNTPPHFKLANPRYAICNYPPECVEYLFDKLIEKNRKSELNRRDENKRYLIHRALDLYTEIKQGIYSKSQKCRFYHGDEDEKTKLEPLKEKILIIISHPEYTQGDKHYFLKDKSGMAPFDKALTADCVEIVTALLMRFESGFLKSYFNEPSYLSRALESHYDLFPHEQLFVYESLNVLFNYECKNYRNPVNILLNKLRAPVRQLKLTNPNNTQHLHDSLVLFENTPQFAKLSEAVTQMMNHQNLSDSEDDEEAARQLEKLILNTRLMSYNNIILSHELAYSLYALDHFYLIEFYPFKEFIQMNTSHQCAQMLYHLSLCYSIDDQSSLSKIKEIYQSGKLTLKHLEIFSLIILRKMDQALLDIAMNKLFEKPASVQHLFRKTETLLKYSPLPKKVFVNAFSFFEPSFSKIYTQAQREKQFKYDTFVSLLDFPDELILMIFSYLTGSAADMFAVSLVCKLFNGIAHDKTLIAHYERLKELESSDSSCCVRSPLGTSLPNIDFSDDLFTNEGTDSSDSSSSCIFD